MTTGAGGAVREMRDRTIDRRDFLRLGASAAAVTAAVGAPIGRFLPASRVVPCDIEHAPAPHLEEATIAELQAAMGAGRAVVEGDRVLADFP